MGYIPKFIHFDRFIHIKYPLGVHWKHEYIEKSTKALYDVFQEELLRGISITLVARGTSGAMVAGAIMNEIHHINPNAKTYTLVVRKSGEDAHCSSLYEIDSIGETRLVVVDDFICSGETIEAIIEALDNYFEDTEGIYKYDALCISNGIEADALKKNKCDDYRMWKGICRRFKYVICCPKLKEDGTT